MARARVTTSRHIDQRLQQGWTPAAIVEEARRRGEPCPSLRTLQRRSAEIAGAKRATPARRARTEAPAAEAAPEPQRLVRVRRPAPAAPAAPPLVAPAPTVPAPPASEPGVDDPEPIDFAGADLETLNRWIERTERQAETADEQGNVAAFASLSRVLLVAFRARAALRPPPPPDPNANPDMAAAAKRAREKLHDLLDRALEAGA